MINPAKARHALGMSLIEILVAIAIFAFGILGLVQLQSGLSRSAAEANTRTVAINIAEETIERRRGFSRITKDTDPSDGIDYAYLDIEPGQATVNLGGLTYNVNVAVQDYWYNRATKLFTTTEPLVAAVSDFKLMTVSVNWGNTREFNIGDGQTTNGGLGSTGVVLSEIISSITSAGDAKSATGGTGGLYLPSITYNPGSNPEIISISLGDNKFKESTTPLPNVIRGDELAETTFDVVTYSQDNEGAEFLRREEFMSISCNCSLRVPSTNAQGGGRPAVWDGKDYTKGEFVSKVYGVGTSNTQSKFCTICCRDHHDGGTGAKDDPEDPGRARYSPFRPPADYWDSGSLLGDHRHYQRSSTGTLTLATAHGQSYMEACRMVRRNGFWQVAQDLRLETLNNFPHDFLDNTTEVGIYSDYVTDAVEAYELAINASNHYELSPPAFKQPSEVSPPVVFPASTVETRTFLPTPIGSLSQQLRSRGVYLDYMSDKLRTLVDCLQAGGTGEECQAPHITTPLEVIPFYDVQLTWLARWNETPINSPVDVTNQAIANNNTHSRGVATPTTGTGLSNVSATVHRSNLGLTGTDPIDLTYTNDLRTKLIYVQSQSTTPPPSMNQFIISGSISANISGFKATDVEISATGAQCNRTSTGFTCLSETAANNPRITVSNYFKTNANHVACSSMVLHGSQTGNNGWTRFTLPTSGTNTANIIIKNGAC